MAQKFAAGQEQRVIAKEYNVHYGTINYWLRQLPNYNELKQQNIINRRKQRGQAITKRMINKPLSKGNQAINKSGPLVG
jgi:adenine specific DNA methylase Mod